MNRRFQLDIAITLGAVLLAVASLFLARNLHIDSSTDVFLPQKSEVIAINQRIEGTFSSMDAIVVGVSQADGKSILNPDSLQVVKDLTLAFSSLDGVDSVTSLTNTEHLTAGSDGLEVVPLLQGTSPEGLKELALRLDEWKEVYEGNLLSKDKTLAAIIIQPKVGLPESVEDTMLQEIGETLASGSFTGLTFSTVGLPVVKNQINKSLVSDLAILAPVVGLLIIIVLFVSFRRIVGIVLPLLSLFLSACLVIGIMALLQITFTMATMLVPVLLLIVGSAYTIHVMSHFYEEVSLFSDTLTPSETNGVVKEVLQRNRLPIIMAGATTAAGFIAQFTSPLAPFRTFGLLSAIGVLLSQLSTLYLLPSLLRLSYHRGIRVGKVRYPRASLSFFRFFKTIAFKGTKLLFFGFFVLLFATILLIPRIKTGTDMLGFFKPNSKLVRDTRLFNEKMNGSGVLTVMISGDAPSSVLDPQFLTSLEEFKNTLERHPEVGNVQTILPYLKRINALLNQDTVPYQREILDQGTFDFFGEMENQGPPLPSLTKESEQIATQGTFYEIPVDPEKYGLQTDADLKALLSQYLMLYSGNLSMFINDALEPDATLVIIQLHPSETQTLKDIFSEIQTFWEGRLKDGWKVETGGGEAVSLALTELVTRSQIYSLLGAIIIVYLLVSLMFRSPLAGLLGLIPVAYALMGIFASMALLSIHLDIVTSLLAALAIGIGVDYAIHFLSAYKRLNGSYDSGQTLQLVLGTTGRAILINAASVTLGFCGLLFSRFVPIRQMGILFCISMVFASLASLTVLPAILNRWKPKFLSTPNREPNPKKRSLL
ncbi:putative RND superfamily exporter [Sphaerochaeta pleomorpha str. Grapes]|uniref:Putative RND superfamily exporter n=1 Tax=Sphaerochaeta pleomorpha (strain ATCC BAA-1885 / DSM 22778 / Grapes) TaxID=158190 RepID=G8QS18_SPHPG|nr:MMPL family transporter [Sphaerochaeta pleomorpha]AEV30016.1 putative RND superfamily exporter [Sphaerochaeta pleomorpha str. Grapes]